MLFPSQSEAIFNHSRNLKKKRGKHIAKPSKGGKADKNATLIEQKEEEEEDGTRINTTPPG